jgi:long-chain acyl-CoA synthetase
MPATTITELYDLCVQRFQHHVASYHKENGRWIATTWADAKRDVDLLARGLMALGVKAGDRVGVLSETRVEWMACDMAVISVGAITVGIYPTSTAEQCAYILKHADVQICIVEDVDQLARLQTIQKQVPTLKKFVLIEGPKGAGARSKVINLDDLRARGKKHQSKYPSALEARKSAVQPDDLAMLVYTSGTTGPPKGVMLTHKNICTTSYCVSEILPHESNEMSVMFLPLAHSLQRVAGYTGFVTGGTAVFAERIDTIVDQMQEFKPTIQPAVPRIYEKVHTKILGQVAQAPPVKQKLFQWAIDIGTKVTRLQREKRPVPPHIAVQHKLADKLVLKKLRNIFGGRVKYMISGAAPIAVELLEFFHACGILILEGYGLTETTAPATINRVENFRFGTVGLDLPICETKIADDGEILIRGDNVFVGYYKNEEATREAFTDDGWFMSGDIGEKDSDGFLRITDRKKEIIITAAGKNVSPANVENQVKASNPLISQCVVYGDKRKFLVALITADPDELAAAASKLNIAETDPEKLTQERAIVAEIQVAIDNANHQLARYETIKYFRVLPRELSVEDNMLTPTLKLKRRNIYGTYQHLLDEMYDKASRPQRTRLGDVGIGGD